MHVLFAHKMDDLYGALEVFETTASQLGLHTVYILAEDGRVRVILHLAHQFAATR